MHWSTSRKNPQAYHPHQPYNHQAHQPQMQQAQPGAYLVPTQTGFNGPNQLRSGQGGYAQNQPQQPGAKPEPPSDPTQKMRDVVKQLKQVINEQKGRVNELRRDARKSYNAGDKESYDLYVDNMVHVRMFIRKITKAITNVNLIGTNLKMNQCNAHAAGAIADFLKLQGQETKVDMDEITRNYFDNQMSLDNGLESFLDNMKDLNDPEGAMEEERARERAKIEAEFGRAALTNAPERAAAPLDDVQMAREMLKS